MSAVAKFGGTSVKTAEAIRQVGQIILANPRITAVVVSAAHGVTNLLVKLCSTDARARPDLISQLLDVYLKLASSLNVHVEDEINQRIARLKALPEKLNLESVDDVLSLGEDISSIIVHAYLNSQGIAAADVDARDFLITDNRFGKACPDVPAIARYKFPDSLFVTQGFIGRTHDGKTTTLGRGGSDYSAALIAEAIQADELLIYTDVPGVYTMDPNLIADARLIPELNFQEMAEMANFGAKVLHPATLEPCVRAQVPVRILSTFEADKPGTLINVREQAADTSTIRAITMRRGQVLVSIKSLKMLNAYGFLANIFGVLAKHSISVDLITTSEVSVALTIDNTNSSSLNPFLADCTLLDELKAFAEITVEEDLVLLSAVGSGLTTPGVIQKMLSVLEPYAIRLVCYGASSSSIGMLVHKDDAVNMARLLHRQLVQYR